MKKGVVIVLQGGVLQELCGSHGVISESRVISQASTMFCIL